MGLHPRARALPLIAAICRMGYVLCHNDVFTWEFLMKSVRIRSRIRALAGLLLCVACAQTNLSAHEAEAPVLAHEGEGNAAQKIEWAIPPRFDGAQNFAANGLAAVKVNNKWGYINEQGKEVIAPRFDTAWVFGANGLALIQIQDKGYGYINAKGEEVIAPRFEEALAFAVNGLAAVKVEGKHGFINEKGESVIPPRFDLVGNFGANGLAPVKFEGKGLGYINEKGEEIIPPRFVVAWTFVNGLARVWVKYKESMCMGYINERGEVVIPLHLDGGEDFAANGLAQFHVFPVDSEEDFHCLARIWEKGEKGVGYINTKGEKVIPPRFDYAYDFAANGLAAVMEEGMYGYIRENGEFVILPRFKRAGNFAANGLARVEVKDKWGYINETGEFVISLRFDNADDFAANGLAAVEVEGKWGYIRAPLPYR
jgi:hypothetical protein